MRDLSALEARVLGVLVEKERTVPDAYPMSLNAVASGCNQKTSRHPMMNAAESDILAALESLKGLSLVIESSGSRVMRYAQNVKRVLQIPNESVSLLAMLMLRGPQTAAELRSNCSRLCRFSDVSAAEAFLQELAGRSSGALVQELPRQAGSRETRWVHLLCGAAGLPSAAERGESQPDMAIDLPEVVAEIRAALSSYERARLGRDMPTLERLLWQSPKAMQYGGGTALSAVAEIAGRADPDEGPDEPGQEEPLLVRRQVTTFGRDFAITAIALGPGAQGWESQVWVRLPQGWRIVAAHDGRPPAAGGPHLHQG